MGVQNRFFKAYAAEKPIRQTPTIKKKAFEKKAFFVGVQNRFFKAYAAEKPIRQTPTIKKAFEKKAFFVGVQNRLQAAACTALKGCRPYAIACGNALSRPFEFFKTCLL